jgi:hypothetical protein
LRSVRQSVEDAHRMTPTDPAVHARRWVLRAALGLAAAYAAYLVLGNALLNTSLARDLANRKTEKYVVGWSRAWTVFPGQVQVRDLRIAGHMRHTVWSAQADAARGRIALLPLLRKELRFPEAEATGVSGGASVVDVVRELPEPRPGGWTMRFDRVVARDVRHAYLNDLVLVGKGHGTAGFVKTLRGGAMEVLPSDVRFEQAVLWRDGARLAWDVTLGGGFSIAKHLRQQAPGIRKLALTDFDLTVHATTAGLSVVVKPGAKPLLAAFDEPGQLTGRLAWRRGELQPGGRLDLVLPVRDDLNGRIASTSANLAFTVDADELRLVGDLAPSPNAQVHVMADLHARGRTIPLERPMSLVQRTSGSIEAQWQFSSLAWLAAFLPGTGLVAFDGAGTVLANLHFTDGNLDAGSTFEVPHVAATVRALGNRFDGDARARLTFESAGAAQLRPHLQATMDDFRIAPAGSPGQPYVHGKDLRIDATSEGARQDLDQLDERIAGRLVFKNAVVPDLRAYNRYLPQTSLQFTGGSGRASGDLHFDRADRVATGELQVSGRDVGLSFAGLALQGDVTIDSRLRRADMDARRFDVDGSRIALKHVRVVNADAPQAGDWWGDITLDRAWLDWDKPMSLDGNLRARMKDVSLLLDVYAQRKDLPKWVGKLVDEGEANATGRVRWRAKTLLLEPFAARNDRFDVEARLRLRDKQATGELLAQWGKFELGVDLEGGQRDYRLIKARQWFESQPSLE